MMSRCATLGLALVFILSSLPALAEMPPAQIGRVTAISGTVLYNPDANSAPIGATVNYPLTTGNTIEAQPRSYAAIDIGAGRLHLDGETRIEIGKLDPGSSTVVLKSGAVIMHILPGGEGQVLSIETPRGALHALQPGYYEVEVTESETRVSALQGGAQFQTVVLRGGMRVTLRAAGTTPVLDAAMKDDVFDRIAAHMEESGENKLGAPKYLSPQITGFQELESSGLWVSTEEIGWVWEPPQVESDWAPFRYGHWAEIAPWGRTWIDDASWGFAPSHYGSWTEVNHRWVWAPGNAAQAAIGIFDQQQGNRGWVALGPEELYPSSSPVIINTVRVVNPPAAPEIVNKTTVNNVSNITNVTTVKDREPSVVVIGVPTPIPPPPPPSNPSSGGIPNRTGLGAAGTPIGGGVPFPGSN